MTEAEEFPKGRSHENKSRKKKKKSPSKKSSNLPKEFYELHIHIPKEIQKRDLYRYTGVDD